MTEPSETILGSLTRRGVSRREFIRFCVAMAGALAMPQSVHAVIAKALETPKRTPVVWLEMQDCAGCSESFLRASRPSAADIVLDVLSVDYHETIMAAAGKQAEEAKRKTIEAGNYLLVVEGSIPTKDNGVYCCIGGRSASDLVLEAASNAIAVIAVGSCASFGGIPKAAPNPTQAIGVMDLVKNKPVLNLPGCPYNVVNLTATVVHFLTFGELPAMDDLHRPLFAYGALIHDNCERRGHFDKAEFVRQWGDAGHQAGWCLYQMGCKGPITRHNCPSVRYNEGTSWPIGAGHGCISCSEPDFWEKPMYKPIQLDNYTPPVAFVSVDRPEGSIPTVNAVATGAVLGAIATAVGIAAVSQLRKADQFEKAEAAKEVEGEAEETEGEAPPVTPASGTQAD